MKNFIQFREDINAILHAAPHVIGAGAVTAAAGLGGFKAGKAAMGLAYKIKDKIRDAKYDRDEKKRLEYNKKNGSPPDRKLHLR